MDANRLTHIYGITSLIVSAVGIIIGFKVGANWKEIALFASGWVTAILISFHLNNSMKFHGDSRGKVLEANNAVKAIEMERDKLKYELAALNKDFDYDRSKLSDEIERLNELVLQRTMTLDFIASIKIPPSAIARKDEESFKANV